MEQLTPIPTLQDNYVWVLKNDAATDAIIVDPGEAAPVLALLAKEGLRLAAIFVTHHHLDHIAGIAEILGHFNVPVYGPALENINVVTNAIGEGDNILVSGFSQQFSVLDVPGHTRGHVAYYCEEFDSPILFCGDTLFSAGCGRLFEGTAEQLFASLNKLAKLPGHTLVCCTHEYTLSNLRFARAVEPDNQDVAKQIDKVSRLREQNLPSLPSRIDQELAINPFLRTDSLVIKRSISLKFGFEICEPVQIFATLRTWKNEF